MPDCVCDMESVENVCDMGPLSLAFLVYALLSVRFIFLPFSGDIFRCLHSSDNLHFPWSMIAPFSNESCSFTSSWLFSISVSRFTRLWSVFSFNRWFSSSLSFIVFRESPSPPFCRMGFSIHALIVSATFLTNQSQNVEFPILEHSKHLLASTVLHKSHPNHRNPQFRDTRWLLHHDQMSSRSSFWKRPFMPILESFISMLLCRWIKQR